MIEIPDDNSDVKALCKHPCSVNTSEHTREREKQRHRETQRVIYRDREMESDRHRERKPEKGRKNRLVGLSQSIGASHVQSDIKPAPSTRRCVQHGSFLNHRAFPLRSTHSPGVKFCVCSFLGCDLVQMTLLL